MLPLEKLATQTGNSFFFAVGTRLLSSILTERNLGKERTEYYRYKILAAVRAGGEAAKYTIFQQAVNTGVETVVGRKLNSCSSSFLTSYLANALNGDSPFRNALSSSFYTYLFSKLPI